MALTVPSWSWTTWAILASVPTLVSSEGILDLLALAGAASRGRIGPLAATAAFRAATLLSRPTWKRHDHLGEENRLSQGNERQLPDARHVDVPLSQGRGLPAAREASVEPVPRQQQLKPQSAALKPRQPQLKPRQPQAEASPWMRPTSIDLLLATGAEASQPQLKPRQPQLKPRQPQLKPRQPQLKPRQPQLNASSAAPEASSAAS